MGRKARLEKLIDKYSKAKKPKGGKRGRPKKTQDEPPRRVTRSFARLIGIDEILKKFSKPKRTTRAKNNKT